MEFGDAGGGGVFAGGGFLFGDGAAVLAVSVLEGGVFDARGAGEFVELVELFLGGADGVGPLRDVVVGGPLVALFEFGDAGWCQPM